MKAFRGYREILQERLSQRLSNNPHYSLRAFARDVGLSSAQLSSVLNNKRGISPQKARQVFKAAKLDTEEFKIAVLQVEQEHSRSPKVKQKAAEELNSYLRAPSPFQLTQDAFNVISDWSHFAVLQVVSLKGYRSIKTPEKRIVWVAKKLGLPIVQVRLVFERLSRLELISLNQQGIFEVCHDTVLSSNGVPSSALREFHKQVIQKAVIAIDAQSVDERCLSSSVFPMLRNELSQVNREIEAFHKKILKKYGRVVQGDGDVVYALSQQFFKLMEV